MATSKSGSTLDALNAQIAALQARADVLRKKEMAQVIAQMKSTIGQYGLTAADLGFNKTPSPAGKPSAPVFSKSTKKAPKGSAAKPAAKPVKFSDDQGHTWGGMGKRPEWFKAALAAGKTPEELRTKA